MSSNHSSISTVLAREDEETLFFLVFFSSSLFDCSFLVCADAVDGIVFQGASNFLRLGEGITEDGVKEE